jgi:hypothetical protein
MFLLGGAKVHQKNIDEVRFRVVVVVGGGCSHPTYRIVKVFIGKAADPHFKCRWYCEGRL